MPFLRSLAHLLTELSHTLLAERITVPFPFAPAELTAEFRGRITITDEVLCKGCGLCARDCPALALELERHDRERFRLIHYCDRCAYCGQCADSCPLHIIVLSNELVSPSQERDTLTQVLVDRAPDSTSMSSQMNCKQPAAFRRG
jgi:formate hydrogenlyase subunit 6/NADH:ubiquinone oxidoreductase subunit I